jgi:beta-mannanase
LLVAGGAVVAAPAASAATDSSKLVFGAVGGDFTSLDNAAGKKVARHVYGQLQGKVPTGEMITVNAQGLPWRTVASAASGSALYQDMVRWADTIKARGGSIELAFGHEPEQSSKSSQGTAEEYKSAFRKVVDTFRSRGVDNVQWVLQMTDWSFRTATTDRGYAGKWYPGDAYVDIIGGDAYNWHTCGEGLGRDVPLSTVAGGVVTFAKAHGKKASLPEFGANKTVQRDKWLREGFAWMKTNGDLFVSAYYFNHPPTNPNNQDCVWPLSTSAEFNAFGAIARDAWTTSGITPTTPEEPAPSVPEEPVAPQEPVVPAPGAEDASSIGAIGDVASLDKLAGAALARHSYGQFQGIAPSGDMITVDAKGLRWSEIAGAAPGDALHENIARWADVLKNRDGKVQLVFAQEPELASAAARGTADEFKAAYRNVVDIFRERGATNVEWVLQLADWSYRTATSDPAHVAKWYPGDAYVDIMGASVYNWHTCGVSKRKDVPLATAASGLVKFAKAHGKQVSLPEFAASQTVQRDEWLQDGAAWMESNKDLLASAFYVNQEPVNEKNSSCGWSLKTTAEKAAFAEMVRVS